MMPDKDEILSSLPAYRDAIKELREPLLANLVMVSEIPAPTFQEAERVRFLQDRFIESGLQNISTDEVGNAVGILPGKEGADRNIIVHANVDTPHPKEADHTVNVDPDCLVGLSTGFNSLGLATLITLPMLLEHLGLELQSNLVLLGTVRSIGRGDLAGLRFFLDNTTLPILAGVPVEGMQLGSQSYRAIGMVRGEITCHVPEEYNWNRFGAAGAINALNEVINAINAIPLPSRPRVSIVFGSIEGGTPFARVATDAALRLDIRSESGGLADWVRQRVRDICAEVSAITGAEVTVDFFARRQPGGIQFSDYLARWGREILEALGIEPRVAPSFSSISAFSDRDIPALRLAITRGETLKNNKERLEIAPMFSGLAQLLGVLLAIDAGYRDED
ncbi:MAG: peptidase dimerization domain-containing protein [Planctomycetes bacterium]|nr:peptidase dimerization domain-containing protein [Planctomycetota bacterium]